MGSFLFFSCLSAHRWLYEALLHDLVHFWLADRVNELVNSVTNLTDEEINRAKAQMKSSIVMSMESSSSNAGTSAYQLIRYNKLIDIDERIEKINNVTKESIEKVIAKTLKSKPTIASIGPINNLEKIDKIESRFN